MCSDLRSFHFPLHYTLTVTPPKIFPFSPSIESFVCSVLCCVCVFFFPKWLFGFIIPITSRHVKLSVPCTDSPSVLMFVCAPLSTRRRGERRLHHRVVHRADVALWGSESGGPRLLGLGHREPDPGQPAVLWERQKQGTLVLIRFPTGAQACPALLLVLWTVPDRTALTQSWWTRLVRISRGLQNANIIVEDVILSGF